MSNESFELSASQIRILLAELKQVGTRAYHLYIRIDSEQADEEWLKKSIPFVFSGIRSMHGSVNTDMVQAILRSLWIPIG